MADAEGMTVRKYLAMVNLEKQQLSMEVGKFSAGALSVRK